MAIQISGSTIINNSKQIQNIGGVGGIISGSVTVPGNNVWKSIKLSGCWPGAVYALGSFNLEDSVNMLGYIPVYTSSVSASANYSGYKNMIVTLNNYQENQIASVITYGGIDYVSIQVKNAYGSNRSFYYTFFYTGPNTPTVAFV